MSSFIPRLNVLYYKHILDKSFRRFFDEYNDKFVKSDNVYVLSKQLVKSKINEARAKKGYQVEGDGANKRFVPIGSKNTK